VTVICMSLPEPAKLHSALADPTPGVPGCKLARRRARGWQPLQRLRRVCACLKAWPGVCIIGERAEHAQVGKRAFVCRWVYGNHVQVGVGYRVQVVASKQDDRVGALSCDGGRV